MFLEVQMKTGDPRLRADPHQPSKGGNIQPLLDSKYALLGVEGVRENSEKLLAIKIRLNAIDVRDETMGRVGAVRSGQ